MSQANKTTTVNPVTQRAHRREKRMRIYGPVILLSLALAFLLALMLIGFSVNRSSQLSMVADGLFVCFTILPCIIIAAIIALLNITLVFGMGKANTGMPRLFGRLQSGVGRLDALVIAFMQGLAGLSIGLLAGLERIERLVGGPGTAHYDETESTQPEEEKV